ncbi:MAG: hypothetical protein RMZ42_32685 [Nostoc sp. DedQUE05]|nr:hypothetical protein [Nostoc sp. DedQUE05]MDZ8096658.1 hypothetical protein [Nostoc sp. DedQUE05]
MGQLILPVVILDEVLTSFMSDRFYVFVDNGERCLRRATPTPITK